MVCPASVCFSDFFTRCQRSSSPYINRFLQPDTVIPSPANSQSWNRFSYVTNNPLRFTDPTGHKEVEGCEYTPTGKCKASDEEIRVLRDFERKLHKRKCKDGNEAYCTGNPVEIGGFMLTMWTGGALLEYAILGGGAVATADTSLWWLQRQVWKAEWAISDIAADAVGAILGKIGMDSKLGTFLMNQVQKYTTHNPNSNTMVLGSYPHYINTGAAKGHSYYSVNNATLYKVLEKAGWAQSLNNNAVYDGMSTHKTMLIDFQAATIGDGLQNELDILDSFNYLYEWLIK